MSSTSRGPSAERPPASHRAARLPLAAAATLFAAATLLAACDSLMPARSEGAKLWSDRCQECHGVDGSGNVPRYMGDPKADLLDDSWEHGGDRGSWEMVIRDGIFGTMPDNRDLTPEQLEALVEHLRDLRQTATGTRS
jgi:mono/diheme cytochrome c family protein